ncbi:cytochrome P450 [[Phormidium ambiguum] IAM M-71]|uniref:Cytochrome P450 n=1 Tax=[Phormidium ambiguum] IAM M-71 TaxID=454136 RepID=A0A1U7I6I2_9CYAN|nr:cytochrome P450 [Phormidium ambiguum]OKH31955.1 cytochrome P450 [Phormidium ambiguum IAM M-71]
MKLPDGPQTPVWLETLQFVLRPIEYLEARQKRYGDAFTIGRNTDSPVVYLSHPQAIEEIFTANPNLFEVGHAQKPVVQPLFGERSLALLDGEPHQRYRRLLMPPFHGERMKAYGQIICDITRQVINEWTIGKSFSVRSAMEEISLRAILQTVFGLYKGQRYDLLRQQLILYLNAIGSATTASFLFFPMLRQDLGSISPWGKFIRLKQSIDRLLTSEIQERQQSIDSERTDVLSLLLNAKDEAGQPMTDVELRSQLLTLLVAGYETTATALTWALYWIHYLPEVKSKLYSEMNTITSDTNPSEIAKLPYLSAVCTETLRLYPVILATPNRKLNSSFHLMEYQFKPGNILIPCIYLTHQREDLYPEPKRFKPERFLEGQFSPYEYLPFGGGNRSCIGMAFAMFEMKLVLATILHEKQLILAKQYPIKPVRRGLTIAPPTSLQMLVKN